MAVAVGTAFVVVERATALADLGCSAHCLPVAADRQSVVAAAGREPTAGSWAAAGCSGGPGTAVAGFGGFDWLGSAGCGLADAGTAAVAEELAACGGIAAGPAGAGLGRVSGTVAAGL